MNYGQNTVPKPVPRERKQYKLSRFNEIVSDYRGKHDISFTMNHVPGLEGIVEMNRAQTFNVCTLNFYLIRLKAFAAGVITLSNCAR